MVEIDELQIHTNGWTNAAHSEIVNLVSDQNTQGLRPNIFNFFGLTDDNRQDIRNANEIIVHLAVDRYVLDLHRPGIFQYVPAEAGAGRVGVPMLTMILELQLSDTSKYFISEEIVFGQTANNHTAALKDRMGVSNGFKRAAVSNWSAYDESGLVNLFYIDAPGNSYTVDLDGDLAELAMNRFYNPPSRIKSFKLPKHDRDQIKTLVNDSLPEARRATDLWVLMGVTYGHYVLHSFNINPILGAYVGSPANQEAELFDVLIPCPPSCGGGDGGN